MTTCHSVDHVMLNFELDEVRWTLNWALARWTGQSDLGHLVKIDFREMKKNRKKSGKKFVDRNEIFLPLPRRTMSARCAPRARSIFYQAGEKLQPAQRAKTDDGRKTKR